MFLTQCFEGMKAYYCVDGKVRLFRPMENMRRLSRSAEAASLPVSLASPPVISLWIEVIQLWLVCIALSKSILVCSCGDLLMFSNLKKALSLLFTRANCNIFSSEYCKHRGYSSSVLAYYSTNTVWLPICSVWNWMYVPCQVRVCITIVITWFLDPL